MKKLLFTLLAMAAIAGIFIATCPNEEEHTDAVMTIFENAATQNTATQRLLRDAIKGAIAIDNYYVFSIGRVKSATSDKKISIGILGKAYLLDKESFTGKKVK